MISFLAPARGVSVWQEVIELRLPTVTALEPGNLDFLEEYPLESSVF